MYKVLKAEGSSANVIIENTETKANIMIGKLTRTIIDTIREGKTDDFTIPEYSSIWNFEVNKETALKLAGLVSTIKKPMRDQRKKPTEDKKEIKITSGVDAFDLIYGI